MPQLQQQQRQKQLLSSTEINFFESLLQHGVRDDAGQKIKKFMSQNNHRKQMSKQYRQYNTKMLKQQQNLTTKTNQTLQKYQQKYQKNMSQQIIRLNQQIQRLQSHCNILSIKCQQKRQENNIQLQNILQLEDKYDQLQGKYLGLCEEFRRKQENMEVMYERKVKDIQSIYVKQRNGLQNNITELQVKNKQLNQLLTSTETEYSKIKQILALQRAKKKQKQEENSKINQNLNKEIDTLKLQIVKLKKTINEQSKINVQKSLHLESMEKTMKEMSRRCVKIQTESRKQIIKERTITKKALQGLQMTRKYSQMELNKSRRKQKEYINSQKQLICKIKEICKDQSTMADTTYKSSRKTQIKSLNTTLKLVRPQRQALTPMISNFIAQDDTTLNLSPIHQVSQFQAKQEMSNSRNNSRNKTTKPNHKSKLRHQIDINTNFISDIYTAGTPCFEHNSNNNTSMFKACR